MIIIESSFLIHTDDSRSLSTSICLRMMQSQSMEGLVTTSGWMHRRITW